MKAPPLLVGSVVINVGLLLVYATSSYQYSIATRSNENHHSVSHASASAGPLPSATEGEQNAESAQHNIRIWSLLKTNDLAQLRDRLRQSGFPADLVRAILSALIDQRLGGPLRASQAGRDALPFWQVHSDWMANSKLNDLSESVRREKLQLMRELLPTDYSAEELSAKRRRYGNLSADQMAKLEKIESDYSDMNSDAVHGWAVLPKEKAETALLQNEREKDLAALLSPEELTEYKLRTSPLSTGLARQLGQFNPTEAEFKIIYDAQNTASQQAPGFDSSDSDKRKSAISNLAQQLKDGLGDTRYVDYLRETDPSFTRLMQKAEDNYVPASTALDSYNLRDTFEQSSNNIIDDIALTPDQKRTALKQLGADARAKIMQMLGPTVGASFADQNQWLSVLDHGSGFTMKDAQPSYAISFSDGSILRFGPHPVYRSVPSNSASSATGK